MEILSPVVLYTVSRCTIADRMHTRKARTFRQHAHLDWIAMPNSIKCSLAMKCAFLQIQHDYSIDAVFGLNMAVL